MLQWPLGINSELDEHAKKQGLGHWSCTEKMGNGCWIRQDGEVFRPLFNQQEGYPVELKEFDKSNPMRDLVFGSLPQSRLEEIAELITRRKFQPGDMVEVPFSGFLHWVPEEEAVPRRMLLELRQKQIRDAIEFTKKKYGVS